MARDPKRRRRRGRGDARDTGDAARDMGLGPDADVPQSPLGEGLAGPAAWAHSSADVDEARLAEGGATFGGEGLDDGLHETEVFADELGEHDPAPDQVEGDSVAVRRAGHVESDSPPRKRGRLLTFLGHSVDELRRVHWPNRRQVGQATAVVLGFVVIAGGYLGLLDQLWQPLIEAILS